MQSDNKCSFILRLWQVKQSNTPDWRVSLEIPETGQRIGFASLEQLFAYLIDFVEGISVEQLTGEKGKTEPVTNQFNCSKGELS